MYKRNAQGWSKHFDFMIVDEVSLQIAFILAVALRHHAWAYKTPLYQNMGFMLLLIDALIIVLFNSMHNVITRGYYVEAAETIKHCFYVFAVATVYMFATQTGDAYSRIIIFLTFLFHILIGYMLRLLWKMILKTNHLGRQKKNSMLVVATPESAEDILNRLSKDELADYQITGVVLTKRNGEDYVCGYPVVAEMDEIADFNPRESIPKGTIAKKIAMDKLQPFCRDVPGFEMEAFSGGTKFRNGDTIMARITPCLENGKTAKVDVLDDNEVGFGSTEYIVFRAKEGNDPDFVYYLVTSPEVREPAIKSMVGSSGRQRVQTDVVQGLKVRVPDLEGQRAIAGILKTLDDMIAANRRVNDNLAA